MIRSFLLKVRSHESIVESQHTHTIHLNIHCGRRIKIGYELGIMEQYMYSKKIRGSYITKFGGSYGGSKIQFVERYMHRYSALGRNNSLFCGKGWYISWENQNYNLVVACC